MPGIPPSDLTYDRVNENAAPYPAYLLPEGGTALGVFSAAFHGWNDVIHFARKDMIVHCVDLDAEKLAQMSRIYPSVWAYTVEDAWQFAERAVAQDRHWDVVSVDPWLGTAADRVAETLPLWCSLARQLVTVTSLIREQPHAPDGWTHSVFPRNARVGWMVLQR